ncbi:MAG: T9SS type A sorting domain-containing protein [Flavobacteriaceae bacterium]|nr:T9SS type A sorting domain-containing protein [Flavobacteriaceae bacterium]
MKRILLITIFAFLGANVEAQTFDWVRTTGSANDESASKIATDAVGNIYTMGSYTGTLDINPFSGTLNVTAVGGTDIYIQKFDALGNFINGISVGGPGNETPVDILIDNNGFLTISGTFQQFIDLDPSSATNGHAVYNFGSSTDFFIAKYDDLAYAYSRAIGGAGDDIVNAMDVDSNNNLVLTGVYRQTVDFNPDVNVANSLTTTAGGEAYVLKLNGNLDYVWVKSFATNDAVGNNGNALAIDNNDNIVIGGEFKGTSDFDPNAGTQSATSNPNYRAGYITKLSSSGIFLWYRTVNTTNTPAQFWTYNNTPDTWIKDLVINSTNDIIIVGAFKGRNVNFDFPNTETGSNTIASNYDTINPSTAFYNYITTGYKWVLNSSGSFVNVARYISDFDSAYAVSVNSVAIDGNDSYYITGNYRWRLYAGSSLLSATTVSTDDIFVLKYTSNNALNWLRDFGGVGTETVNDIKVSNGKLLLTGGFAGTCNFDTNSGTQNVTSQGALDNYLLSLNETSLLSNSSFEDIDFSMYPNPVSSTLSLKTKLNDFIYTIYSIEGKIVKQGNSNMSETSVDVSNFNSGIYLVELESEGSKSIQKIIKN